MLLLDNGPYTPVRVSSDIFIPSRLGCRYYDVTNYVTGERVAYINAVNGNCGKRFQLCAVIGKRVKEVEFTDIEKLVDVLDIFLPTGWVTYVTSVSVWEE